MLTEGNRNSDLGGEGGGNGQLNGPGALKTNGFEGSKFLEFAHVSERKRFGGVGVGLGRLGFAGGLVRGSAASLGPIGRFRFGVKLTRGFHLNGFGE